MTRRAVAVLAAAFFSVVMPVAVSAESSLTTSLDSADSPRNRLVVETPIVGSGGSVRVIVWTEWEIGPYPTPSDFRAALTTPSLGVGPVVLLGGLRDLASPHPTAPHSPIRERATEVRVDARMSPARRYGITYSPAGTPFRWSWFGDSVRDSVVGSIGGPSVPGGSSDIGVRHGTEWAELTVVGTFPHDPSAGRSWVPDGWFHREPPPADTFHLLFRAAGTPVRSPRIAIVPAAAVSLGPTIGPGWWTRLGLRVAPVGNSGDGKPAVRASGRIAMSSPRYCGPGAEASPHALSLSGGIVAEAAGGLRAQTGGSLVLDWVPAVLTPGVPLSLQAVQPYAAEFGIGWVAGVGGVESVLDCTVSLDWSGAAACVKGVSVTGTLRSGAAADAAVRHAGEVLRVLPEFSVTVRRSDSVEAVGTAELGIGAAKIGRTSPFTLVGTVVLRDEEAARLAEELNLGCRVEFTSAHGECRGGVTARWIRDSGTPPVGTFHLTWKAVTGGE